jgi:dynamin-like GTPase MGM1, mitochondrial
MQRSLHRPATGRASGLLRTDGCLSAGRSRQWPFGASSIHNVPAVRSISFARVLPQLALKMARLPALFGASMIAGLAYIQYQAARKLKRPQ